MNKKIVKVIGNIILIIFMLWVILVIVDCYRINNYESKPLITIATKEYENVRQIEDNGNVIEIGEEGIIYTGLGYVKKCYRKWQGTRELKHWGYSLVLFGFITIGGMEEN